MTPSQVLRHGIGALSGLGAPVPGDRLPLGEAGPGLRVSTERSRTPEPSGIGREFGPEGLGSFLEYKTVNLPNRTAH